MKKATMSSLPREVEEKILLRLPVKSIFRFKSVCKSWYTLICSPKFAKDHLSLTEKRPRLIMIRNTNRWLDKGMFYSIDYASLLSASSSSSSSSTCKREGAVPMDDPVKGELLNTCFYIKMFASCNGLLCLNFNGNRTLILWNPYTKESQKIILPSCVPWPVTKGYGFGYSSRINNYKFVHIDRDEVYVYTLGSDEWRRVNASTICDFYYEGLDLNGVLHWLGTTAIGDFSKPTKLIVAFDLSSETYMNLPLPEESIMLHPDGSCDLKLKVLGDSLCLVCGVPDVQVDVWVMQNYGVTESWTKQFTTRQVGITEHPYFLEFHWSFDSGEILIQFLEHLFLYDQENDRIRRLNINGTDDKFSSVEMKSYAENLVSLTCNRNLFI
ncbi:F-box/kelch-repeat protein At3g23880-like [Papaver somniferum]|uniref:F-box/kelch-repeat protein At3g23880-like n=1 Tax=Papaver somniferum TaxID=3469 RepID=UPI000E6F991B|nr:F-box/kelch-repeat protein At3g23880-like [Papaver somniferum]